MSRKIKENKITKTQKSNNSISVLSTDTQELLNKIETIKKYTKQKKMTKTNKVDKESHISKKEKNHNI